MCGAEVPRTTQGSNTSTYNYQWRRRIWSGRSMEAQDMRTGNSILGVLEGLWEWAQSMDSGIRVAICKTGNRRLLDKMFKSKPIKREGKISFWQPKYSLELLQKKHVFPKQQQQQLHHCSCLPQSLYFKETKQHGPSTSNEERKRRLNKTIPQDVKRNRGDNQHTNNGERFEENSRRNEYDSHRDEEDNFNSQYQQSDNECHEHHPNSRRPLVFDTKQHGWLSISSSKNAG